MTGRAKRQTQFWGQCVQITKGSRVFPGPRRSTTMLPCIDSWFILVLWGTLLPKHISSKNLLGSRTKNRTVWQLKVCRPVLKNNQLFYHCFGLPSLRVWSDKVSNKGVSASLVQMQWQCQQTLLTNQYIWKTTYSFYLYCRSCLRMRHIKMSIPQADPAVFFLRTMALCVVLTPRCDVFHPTTGAPGLHGTVSETWHCQPTFVGDHAL